MFQSTQRSNSSSKKKDVSRNKKPGVDYAEIMQICAENSRSATPDQMQREIQPKLMRSKAAVQHRADIAGNSSAVQRVEAKEFTVPSGWGLTKIAKHLGVTVESLKNANKDKLERYGKVQGFRAGAIINIPTNSAAKEKLSPEQKIAHAFLEYKSGKLSMPDFGRSLLPFIAKDSSNIKTILNSLPAVSRDNLAYVLTANSNDTELAAFPKELLELMEDNLSGIINTTSWEKNWKQAERIGNILKPEINTQSVKGKQTSKPSEIAANDISKNKTEISSDDFVSKAFEYVNANPNKTYGFDAKKPTPSPEEVKGGATVDCAGLVRSCMLQLGMNDPYKDESGKWRKGIEDGKGGYYNNGVALLISKMTKIEIDDLKKGDLVTMWTERSEHQGPNDGDFDHIVIVTKVIKENGKVTAFNYIDSGGSNSKVGEDNPAYIAGPREKKNYKLNKTYSWRKHTGAYRFIE